MADKPADKPTETDEQRLARQNKEIGALTDEHIKTLQGFREQFAAHPPEVSPNPMDGLIVAERAKFNKAALSLTEKHRAEGVAPPTAPVAKQKDDPK